MSVIVCTFSKMKTKLIPLIIIFIIVYTCGSLPVRAHDLPGGNPVLVEGFQLEENTDPQPTKLPWTEHFVNHVFNPKETLQFDLDEKKLGLITESDLTTLHISWHLESVTQVTKAFSHAFSKNGKYPVNVRVSSDTKEYFDEDFTVIVGDVPAPDAISVDGKTRTTGETIPIRRSNIVNFSVVKPDSGYDYFWDLGDAEVAKETQTSKRFLNTKLPAYIILRKQGKNDTLYSDTFVRVDSDEAGAYTVLEPHVVPQPSDLLSPQILVIVATVIILGAGITALLVKRSSN